MYDIIKTQSHAKKTFVIGFPFWFGKNANEIYQIRTGRIKIKKMSVAFMPTKSK